VEEALIRARIFVMDRSGSDTPFRAVLMLVQTLIREDGGSKPGRMSTDLSVCPFCKASPATRDSTQSAMPGRKSFQTIQERPNGMKSVGIHRRVLIQAPPSGCSSVGPSLCENKLLGTGRRDPRCLLRRNETRSTWHGPCTCWPQGPGRRPHAVTLPHWHCAGLCE
jgi:hypothetical protein